MKDKTIKKMKENENYTLLLNEATDESNRSELYSQVQYFQRRETCTLIKIVETN